MGIHYQESGCWNVERKRNEGAAAMNLNSNKKVIRWRRYEPFILRPEPLSEGRIPKGIMFKPMVWRDYNKEFTMLRADGSYERFLMRKLVEFHDAG